MKYIAFFLLLTLSACSTYSDQELNEFDVQIEAYLQEKNIECERSESGLYYKIIEQGKGRKAQFKDVVSFTYRGELLDGLVFDEQIEPVEFELEQLIACWKEVILELNEGGEAFIVSPPQLGYGDYKLEDIPQNSILAFHLKIDELN